MLRVAPSRRSAEGRSRSKHESWEDQLFFSRLRRHAKWVFVFLALVFALSFVLFGVGSGSTGIGDALQNFFSDIFERAAASRRRSLQKKAEKNPKDAKAWRELATEARAEREDSTARSSRSRATPRCEPKDDERARRSSAGSTCAARDDYAQQYVAAQTKADVSQPGAAFKPPRPRRSARRSERSDLGRDLDRRRATDTTRRLLEVPRHADARRSASTSGSSS